MLKKIKEIWCQKLSYATFRLEFWKNFTLEISTLKFVKMQSFMLKKKKKKFGPKKPLLGTFRAEFENSIVIFENSTLEFVKTQSFILKKKIKFGTKIVLLGI